MSKGTRKNLGLLSFIAVIFYTLGIFIGKLIDGLGIFVHIGNVLILLIALYLGKDYADNSKSQFWKVTYYIVAIIAIAAFVFGII